MEPRSMAKALRDFDTAIPALPEPTMLCIIHDIEAALSSAIIRARTIQDALEGTGCDKAEELIKPCGVMSRLLIIRTDLENLNMILDCTEAAIQGPPSTKATSCKSK